MESHFHLQQFGAGLRFRPYLLCGPVGLAETFPYGQNRKPEDSATQPIVQTNLSLPLNRLFPARSCRDDPYRNTSLVFDEFAVAAEGIG